MNGFPVNTYWFSLKMKGFPFKTNGSPGSVNFEPQREPALNPLGTFPKIGLQVFNLKVENQSWKLEGRTWFFCQVFNFWDLPNCLFRLSRLCPDSVQTPDWLCPDSYTRGAESGQSLDGVCTESGQSEETVGKVPKIENLKEKSSPTFEFSTLVFNFEVENLKTNFWDTVQILSRLCTDSVETLSRLHPDFV